MLGLYDDTGPTQGPRSSLCFKTPLPGEVTYSQAQPHGPGCGQLWGTSLVVPASEGSWGPLRNLAEVGSGSFRTALL